MRKSFLILLGTVALGGCASQRGASPAAPTTTPVRLSVVATDVVYYLDGKEISPRHVETLDPNSIETVEVIKGESARRILGDRAAYGVVRITSKTANRR